MPWLAKCARLVEKYLRCRSRRRRPGAAAPSPATMRLFHRVAAVLALAACDESPDVWRARMAAELDRSLALYARPRDADEAELVVRRLLGDPYRSVLVLRNRLIFDRRLFSRAKVMHHVEFVRSVMEAGPSENFAYQFEWNANGANSEDQLVREGCPTPAAMPRRRVKPKSWAAQPRQSPIPRVVIAKRYGGGRRRVVARGRARDRSRPTAFVRARRRALDESDRARPDASRRPARKRNSGRSVARPPGPNLRAQATSSAAS